MNQQNMKNDNLILIKNRRILTRTEHSKQKLQTNSNCNYQSQKISKNETRSKITQNARAKNNTQHKKKSKKMLDDSVFWKTAAKKKKVRAQCFSHKKTQSLDQILLAPNEVKRNDRPKCQSKSNTRIIGMLKKKIFSHKNLLHASERLRSNTSESTLRMNNDNSMENDIPSDKTERIESERVTEKTFLIKGIKDFTKRFKTENVQPQENISKILKNIYSSRRRKLRINSNQFSVQLRINMNKSSNTNIFKQENTVITNKTDCKKQCIKLPKQFMRKIKDKSEISEDVSSPVNLSFSSDNDNIQRRNFNLERKKIQNKNQVQIPQNRKKSRTLLSNQMMSKIEEQNIFLPKKDDSVNESQTSQSKNQQNSNKKQENNKMSKNQNNKILQSETISINDIKIVWAGQSGKTSQKILQNKEIEHKVLNLKPQLNKIRKPKIKYELPLKDIAKHFQKQKRYNDPQQSQLIQQITLTGNNIFPNLSLTQDSIKSQKSVKSSLQSPFVLNTYTIQSISDQKTKRSAFEKSQQSSILIQDSKQSLRSEINVKQNCKQDSNFNKIKEQIQALNCIGQVGGICSINFPKKDFSWMAPTLLLYIYCLHFRKNVNQSFKNALQSQFCLQKEYQNFIEQNQQIQKNINKIHQKAKKKNLITENIERFILPNFDLRKEKINFFDTLFQQINNFSDLLLKIKEKEEKNKKEIYFCGIKMVEAFIITLKIEKQISYANRNIFIEDSSVDILQIQQINFTKSIEQTQQKDVQQSVKLMQRNFQLFKQSLRS